MAENKMTKVAKLFDKKIGEEFTVKWKLNGLLFKAKFLHTGIYAHGLHKPDDTWYKARDGILMELVRGDCEIVE